MAKTNLNLAISGLYEISNQLNLDINALENISSSYVKIDGSNAAAAGAFVSAIVAPEDGYNWTTVENGQIVTKVPLATGEAAGLIKSSDAITVSAGEASLANKLSVFGADYDATSAVTITAEAGDEFISVDTTNGKLTISTVGVDVISGKVDGILADYVVSGVLDSAVADVTSAFEAADDALAADVQVVSGAVDYVSGAIDYVSGVVSGLDGDFATDEELAQAVADVTSAFEAADDALAADVQVVSGAVDDVAADLASAVADYKANDGVLSGAIDDLASSFTVHSHEGLVSGVRVENQTLFIDRVSGTTLSTNIDYETLVENIQYQTSAGIPGILITWDNESDPTGTTSTWIDLSDLVHDLAAGEQVGVTLGIQETTSGKILSAGVNVDGSTIEINSANKLALTEAYKASVVEGYNTAVSTASAALAADIQVVSGVVSGAVADYQAKDAFLSGAIDYVSGVVSGLDGDFATDEELAQAVADVTSAFEAADTALAGDIQYVSGVVSGIAADYATSGYVNDQISAYDDSITAELVQKIQALEAEVKA